MHPLVRARDSVGNLDLSPPDWIIQLLSTQDRSIPWRDMVRSALSVGTPLATGYASGHLDYGVLIGIGALPAMLADRGGPLSARLRRAAFGLAAGALGLYLGRLLINNGWSAVVVVGVLSLVAGLISPIGAIASFASLQFLVYIAIGSGFILAMPPWEFPALFLIGGAWAMVLSTAQAVLEGISSAEGSAVGAVYDRVADLLDAAGSDPVIAAREQLTSSINAAYDQILGSHSVLRGRNERRQWLDNMLCVAMPVVEAAVAFTRAADGPAQDEIAVLRAIGASMAGRGGDHRMVARSPHEPPHTRALREALERAVDEVHRSPTGRERRESLRDRVADLQQMGRDMLTAGENWSYGIRVALCMAVAEAARETVPIQRPYWILLTVAIVVKPDLGSVFARAVQRGAGTVVGVLVGALLLDVVPRGTPVLLAIAALAALVPLGMRRNYGLLATFITPLVVMLIDLATHQAGSILEARVEATLAGCAIVLVFGYMLWPQTWRTRVGQRVSEAIDVLVPYLEAAFTGNQHDRNDRRRAVYRKLSETRTELQRMLAEPTSISARATAWRPVVNGLERVADAITEAGVFSRHEHLHLTNSDLAPLVGELRDLREAMLDHRQPATWQEVLRPELIGIQDEISSVMNLVEGDPST